MKSIAIKDLSENFFEVIGKEWMLVTAGSKEHFNTMGRYWLALEQAGGVCLYSFRALYV